MTWTRDPPTEPGWYWVRDTGYEPEPRIVYLEDHDGELFIADVASEFGEEEPPPELGLVGLERLSWHRPPDTLNWEWFGPLAAP